MVAEDRLAVARATEILVTRASYDDEHRRNQTWIHSVMALVAGFLLIIGGPPDSLIRLVGEHNTLFAAVFLSWWPTVGGMISVHAIKRRPHDVHTVLMGFRIIKWWYMVMALMVVLIAVGAVLDSDPATTPTPYAVSVYVGLFLLVRQHVKTLTSYRSWITNRGV